MSRSDRTTSFHGALLGRILSYRDEMVRFQIELTAVRALGPDNGGEGESERAAFIEARAAEWGLTDLTTLAAPDPRVPSGVRPNLILRVRGAVARPTVWVMAHMDTVPPGEASLWDGDPFVARLREDGTIVGRGVEDNQHGLTAGLFALRALADEGVVPPTDVCLLLVADEETGNAFGIEHVLEAAPALFDPADLVIVPDAGTADGTMLEVAEKSAVWIRFAVMGRQVHASTPDVGLNAHRAAARLTVRLDEHLAQTFSERDDLYQPPRSTFEPTKREANVPNVNTVPGEDIFYFDCRLLPTLSIDAVKETVAAVVADIEKETGATVTVTYPAEHPAAPATAPDAPVVRELAAALGAARGIETVTAGIGGGTVAAAFRRRGIPAVVWATLEETAHAPNEYCRVDNLVADAQVFALVFARGL